jgi:diaminobutyrate-2-oxoglutarate transaminase
MLSEINNVFARRESNVRSYCRSFPVVFDKAEGSIIWDESGQKYIDFFAGAGALNYGHNNPEMRDKLIEYLTLSSISHSLDLHTAAKQSFLESFEASVLRPRQLPHKVMFSGPTGTNAVESALKIARVTTGRQRIAAFTNGFHGMTLGALAATGNSYNRAGAGCQLPDVDRYPFDGYLGKDVNSVDLIERLIDDPSSGYDAPAAFLLETIQAEGGVNAASAEWLQSLAKLAKRIGALLIVDDIQVGCGRTGDFFSFEMADIQPDLVCLSKSIGGYGLPMAIVLVSPEIDALQPGQHNGTFRGNNLAFVTASHALTYWQTDAFSTSIHQRTAQTTAALDDIVAMSGGEFKRRGRGMIQGLVCPSADVANAISESAFRQGLIIETCGAYGEVVKLLPALNIPSDVLTQGLSILKDCSLENTTIGQAITG